MTTTAIQPKTPGTVTKLNSEIVANIVLKGDISGLSQAQKVEYYRSVCERVGLDPATQPFQLLKLSGKEVLYCSKSGAEQLTKAHNVSHAINERQTVSDIHIVYVRASLPDGRFEDSSGAVAIGALRGDALANAFMKAETKAKRRSTLSLLGLGMLDETEIETIPGAEKVKISEEPSTDTPEVFQPPSEVQIQGASFNEFNPTKELVPKGKYQGIKWIECPVDYLQWLESKGVSKESRGKASATLKYKQQIRDQQVDDFATVFDAEKKQ